MASERLSITLPIDVWWPGRGGAERYLDHMARELLQRGHQITVLCREARPAPSGGPPIELVNVPRFPRALREAAFARAVLAAHRGSGRRILYQVRHALEADVYHPHGGSLLASRREQGRARGLAARSLRHALALCRPTYHLQRRLDRAVFERSPHLLTISVSAKVEEDYRKFYPDLKFDFRRLVNPVDTSAYHDLDRSEREHDLAARLGVPRETPVAVFAAHRFAPKGLGAALEALARSPRWHLAVAGDDDPGPHARAAGRLGVGDRVHWLGRVEGLRPLLAGARALILPTHYDPCSLVVLEAMACGVPPITTRANGAAELLEPGRTGWVVSDPSDHAGLAAALEGALEHGREAGRCARAAAEALDWRSHIDRLELILEEAARRRC